MSDTACDADFADPADDAGDADTDDTDDTDDTNADADADADADPDDKTMARTLGSDAASAARNCRHPEDEAGVDDEVARASRSLKIAPPLDSRSSLMV